MTINSEEDMVSKQQKFQALVDAFTTPLFRYALWLCGNKATADDLVQETFLRAWRAIDSLLDEKSAKAWLTTILRREHARLYERKRPDTGDYDFDNMPGADMDYDTRPEAFALRQCLATLSPEYKDPLLLQVIGGFSCDEIAEQLDLSKAAVMTRLFRARKMLREQLASDAPSNTARGDLK